MKRIGTVVCIFLLAAMSLSACAKPPGPAQLLAGKWDGSVSLLEFQALEFVPNPEDELAGTVNLSLLSNLVKGSYRVYPGTKIGDPDRLEITYSLAMISTTRSYILRVDETNLSLQGENGALSLNYHRPAAEAPPA